MGGIKMADMMDKTVLFLAVSSLKGLGFEQLWQCFGNLNASTRIAGANADEEIRSKEGNIDTRTDMSFNEASVMNFDVVVIPDEVTANFVKNNSDAMQLIKDTFDNNSALVAIGGGVQALISAGIVRGLQIAAPQELQEEARNAGAVIASDAVCVSNNLFTALEGSDMQMLCNAVSDYITSLSGGMAA
jgi:protease I